jgi:hypothetical protein
MYRDPNGTRDTIIEDGWKVVSTTVYNQAPCWSVLRFPEGATVDTLDAFFKAAPLGSEDRDEPAVNEMNFVLFSTSGVHGSYTTLEECEAELKLPEAEREQRDDGKEGPWPVRVTVLLIQPRIVGLRYGNLLVRNLEDVERLKKYRADSHAVIAQIGIP